MFSFMAALRNLVLPFGTIAGTRIVLDGVNGRISIFNASNAEVIREDAATGLITAGTLGAARVVMDGPNARFSAFNAANSEKVRIDATAAAVTAGSQTTGARLVLDGANTKFSGFDAANFEGSTVDPVNGVISTQASSDSSTKMIADKLIGSLHESVIEQMPPSYTGHTWLPTQLRTTYTGAPDRPAVSFTSSRESGTSNAASLALIGGRTGNDRGEFQLYGEDGYIVCDNPIFEPKSAAVPKALVDFSSASLTFDQSRDFQINYGSTGVTTNANGDASIATGFASIVGVVAWNGNSVARGNLVVGRNTTTSGGTFNVRVHNGHLNTAFVGTMTVEWIALGLY